MLLNCVRLAPETGYSRQTPGNNAAFYPAFVVVNGTQEEEFVQLPKTRALLLIVSCLRCLRTLKEGYHGKSDCGS